MARDITFQPDWASPPGDTIADILNENNISLKKFSCRMEYTSAYTRKLLNGRVSITDEIAGNLAHALGTSKTFWMNRESQYREDLILNKEMVQEKKEWLRKLPLSDMTKFGWIAPSKALADKEDSCLQFFDSNNVEDWYEMYNDLLMSTSFRTSASFDSQPESVVTWIRQGMVESKKLKTKSWSIRNLKEILSLIKPLTRIKDPQKFIPQLQNLFSRCGVAIAIVPAPAKCRASGATYFMSAKKPLLLLSFRHLTDDHFWFSLFHEVGHLMLHGNKSLFLEGLDKCSSVEEKEADNFAAEILISSKYRPELKKQNAKEWRNIVRFAKKIGISPGIVVGQLQYMGIIKYSQLNKLKVRYKWDAIRA